MSKIKFELIDKDNNIVDKTEVEEGTDIKEVKNYFNEKHSGSYLIVDRTNGCALGVRLKSWGGTREGSGRPNTGRSKKNIYVTEEELIEVKKFLEELRRKVKSNE